MMLAILDQTKLFQFKILETAVLVTIALGLLAGYRLGNRAYALRRAYNRKIVKSFPFDLKYALISFIIGIVSVVVLILIF